MNAEQLQTKLSGENTAAASLSMAMAPALSAMGDGEISEAELDALMGSMDADALPTWHAYHVIGDALRGQAQLTGGQPAGDFLAAVRIGMASSDLEREAVPRLLEEAALPVSVQAHREAANDVVFRWKLVAGFASLAAVMAVSWSVVSGTGSNGTEGAQLASNAPEVSAPAAVVAAGEIPQVGAPVAVNTGQGVVIRDAQLEALLAEHRQHGGMSALQTPSGFIRNATYDAAGR
jgi:sigma-E factor negative regulatory protein RseA